MKSCFVALFAVVLVAGLYVYVGSTTPIKDDPVTTGATNAVENPVAPATSNISESPRVNVQPAKVEEPALIGSLRSRTHTIHLYAGKLTVEDANGKVLARLINQEQFSMLLPDLFSEFRQMYAGGQIIADNLSHGKLSDGWVYTVPRRVGTVFDP